MAYYIFSAKPLPKTKPADFLSNGNPHIDLARSQACENSTSNLSA